MSVSFSFDQTPEQANAYLKNKGFQLNFNYDDMIAESHHAAFTVAKITRLDLLNDVFSSLQSAMDSGENFKDWQARIKPTLQEKGWWGETEVTDPKTGEIKTIDVGSRRLRTIFNTNMRVAYNVARYGQMQKLSTQVYWRYSSALLPSSRGSHRRLHGTTLHKDDAFWSTNYPPNAWNCKCKVRAYSKRQAEKRGMSISKTAPKNVASPDWSHDIGAGSKVGKLNKIKLGDGLPTIPANPDLDKLNDEQLKARFYQTLGIAEGDSYVDAVGDPMDVDDGLFLIRHGKKKGESKVKKRERHLYIDELAKTIADPDEIYLEIENRTGKSKLIKKMFRYFKDEKGNQKATMALFRYEQDKTLGASIYVIDRKDVVAQKRVEKLIYKKK